MMVDFWNAIVSIINTVMNVVFFFLPDSFVQATSFGTEAVNDWINWLCWFVPVNEVMAFVQMWCVAIGVYLVAAFFLGKISGKVTS